MCNVCFDIIPELYYSEFKCQPKLHYKFTVFKRWGKGEVFQVMPTIPTEAGRSLLSFRHATVNLRRVTQNFRQVLIVMKLASLTSPV